MICLYNLAGLIVSFFITLVPENAPINLQVTGSSPSSVFVSWIEPTVPNGVITGYNLYVNYSDGSPVAMLASSSFSTNYTITGLTPYQLITVAVSATTTAGEGPLSDSASGRSTEEGAAHYIS